MSKDTGETDHSLSRLQHMATVSVKAIERLAAECKKLTRELDEARRVARMAVAAWHLHQELGSPSGCGPDEVRIQELYESYPWLKAWNDEPA